MKNVSIRFKRRKIQTWKSALLAVLAAAFFFLLFQFPQKDLGRCGLTASAYNADPMTIECYDVDMTVQTDRKIVVEETITMRANQNGSVFTRSLPLEGDRYYNIEAECDQTSGFSYEVLTDEEDIYLNVECRLPVSKGETRKYTIRYVMEIGADDVKNGMRLDVIGYGWPVALHNVNATLHFPARATVNEAYRGGYGSQGSLSYELSEDGKTLFFHVDTLEKVYNSYYYESMAEGVTLQFTFEKGVLDSYAKTRIFTDDMWKIALFGALVIGASVAVLMLTRSKRELISVVNVKAPDDMDPMKMGKILDGTVDGEDVTSMIYYFARKGYLIIHMENEDDPTLIRKVVELPSDAPVYEKTLFKGLFKKGESVKVSDLENNFYESVQTAIAQVPPMKMYDKKSVVGYVCGGVLGALFAMLVPFCMGFFKIGGGYTYLLGIVLAIPIVGILILGLLRENYRYKWKSSARTGVLIAELLLAALFAVVFIVLFANFLMTGYEKAVVCAVSFSCTFITTKALSRTEKYLQVLGEIVGFKDFIIVTEEEKIKFMLEENPELYYKILPYAQVLGVTKEWEEKFANILLEPPTWYVSSSSVFDYLLLRHCMTRTFVRMMAAPNGKGSFAGYSGGGGGFGGFGGGGHGGGGGGFR
ncbi:MAG: DUF2207 domain-containing protein [Clostridia bacterium]|nr:DUF2207 domain-containing protein [Clostridia bacterium]